MKSLLFILCFLAANQGFAKELKYTASTPAGKSVRTFLGIDQSDSIDFVRWYLDVNDMKTFAVTCTYGIGKPNTNGFIDEKMVKMKGTVTFNNDVLVLDHNGRRLSLVLLNTNILHILDENNTMMAGNEGWSYTLNRLQASPAYEVNVKQVVRPFTDSVVFAGRTPCRHMEELLYNQTRPECYKKKWLVRLYRGAGQTTAGTYTIGTRESISGTWKLKENKEGKIIYSLDLKNGNTLDLLQADANVVYFIDKKGDILVGDHDFSYSLTRSPEKSGSISRL
jgi:hypothetical protein